MKFYIETIILWQKSGHLRTISLENNKVNVITGNSNRGKTAILQIIDYCFFASDAKIPESKINENVEWYGLKFHINDKCYTIARKSLFEDKVSDDYYFSSNGEIPLEIKPNNEEKYIKNLVETEFSINKNVAMPFGGSLIQAGSKISLRYFLMFNTISGSLIENDADVFFDKQNIDRYREALPRIFDIALGIETLENILKKERKAELDKDLRTWQRKKARIENSKDDFLEEKQEIVKKAKEFSIISPDLSLSESIRELRLISKSISPTFVNQQEKNEYNNFQEKIDLNFRKIKNLERFINGYDAYKSSLRNTSDSLKPITFLLEHDADVLKTSVFEDILKAFEKEAKIVKSAIQTRTPINNQVIDEIAKLNREIDDFKSKQALIPEKFRSFNSENEKYYFLGQVQTKLDLFLDSEAKNTLGIDSKIGEIENEINSLKIIDTSKQRNVTINLIEEIVEDYMKEIGNALENYSIYKPVFDYERKALKLRKPKTSYLENVGSSSNHMFLHLLFTLSIHEACIRNKSPFIAPFLVIDQPSRPYWIDKEQETDLTQTDQYKISQALKLLDKFIANKIEANEEFQIILFEHIHPEFFSSFKNVILVEEFRGGNALIHGLPNDDENK